MKKFLLVFILVIFSKNCFAQEEEENQELEQPVHGGCKGCRPMNYLKKFPCYDLEGVWYYTAIYDEMESSQQKDCLQIEFKFVNCSTFDVTLCYQNGTEVTCLSDATFVSVDQVSPSGHALVSIPNFPIKYEVYLLDIVKDEYAIFYSCKTVNDNLKYEEFFILTRHGVIYENYGALWTQTLAHNSLDASKMSLVKQGKTCNYEFEATH